MLTLPLHFLSLYVMINQIKVQEKYRIPMKKAVYFASFFPKKGVDKERLNAKNNTKELFIFFRREFNLAIYSYTGKAKNPLHTSGNICISS